MMGQDQDGERGRVRENSGMVGKKAAPCMEALSLIYYINSMEKP